MFDRQFPILPLLLPAVDTAFFLLLFPPCKTPAAKTSALLYFDSTYCTREEKEFRTQQPESRAGAGQQQLSLDNVRGTSFPIPTACTLDYLRLPRKRKKETGLDPRLDHAHKLWTSSFFVKMRHVFSLSMFLEMIHQREISLRRVFFGGKRVRRCHADNSLRVAGTFFEQKWLHHAFVQRL